MSKTVLSLVRELSQQSALEWARTKQLEAALRDLLHVTQSPDFGPDDIIVLAQAQAKAEAALAPCGTQEDPSRADHDGRAR